MGTLLEAIDIVLETHFRFGFPNGSPIGDSPLRCICMGNEQRRTRRGDIYLQVRVRSDNPAENKDRRKALRARSRVLCELAQIRFCRDGLQSSTDTDGYRKFLHS